jgi:hypothetical protein
MIDCGHEVCVVAALDPPRDRRLVAAKLDDVVHLDGAAWPLFTNR